MNEHIYSASIHSSDKEPLANVFCSIEDILYEVLWYNLLLFFSE